MLIAGAVTEAKISWKWVLLWNESIKANRNFSIRSASTVDAV